MKDRLDRVADIALVVTAIGLGVGWTVFYLRTLPPVPSPTPTLVEHTPPSIEEAMATWFPEPTPTPEPVVTPTPVPCSDADLAWLSEWVVTVPENIAGLLGSLTYSPVEVLVSGDFYVESLVADRRTLLTDDRIPDCAMPLREALLDATDFALASVEAGMALKACSAADLIASANGRMEAARLWMQENGLE